MTFLSSQSLEGRLVELVPTGGDASRIDCNAIQLRVGPEYYVSPTDSAEAKKQTLSPLDIGKSFTIPAGQFAFLLTEEVVNVPRNMMAFISLRTKWKFRGLVNVSGFHVDPGYRGRIVFSVFNAGPSVIHVKRYDEIFLIWFAKLDEESTRYYDKKGRDSIMTEVISSISGELVSLSGLGERIRSLENANTVMKVLVGILATAAVGTMVKVWSGTPSSEHTTPAAVAPAANSPPPVAVTPSPTPPTPPATRDAPDGGPRAP